MIELTALENPHGANRDLTEGPFYRFSALPRFHTTKTQRRHQPQNQSCGPSGGLQQLIR
jgi:hypothetical protein